MRFAIKCPHCSSTIKLEPPWMRPVYSCHCKPSDSMLAFSLRLAATQAPKCITPMQDDALTPDIIARMYYYLREVRIKHADTCGLCRAVAEQGLVCPDLEALRDASNKWLALKVAYPEEKQK